MHIERLQLLVTLLKEKLEEQKTGKVVFSLSSWILPRHHRAGTNEALAASSQRPDILEHGFCGTSACAVGYACLDERFNAQGLVLGRFNDPCYRTSACWDAVERFFEIDGVASIHLFSEGTYPNHGSTTLPEVIERLEAFIRDGGLPQ